jgi:hypothetical protein
MDASLTIALNRGVKRRFAKGPAAGTAFDLSWDDGRGEARSATFANQKCLCQQLWCDKSQETHGQTADCSGMTGGAVCNACLPSFGLAWKDDDDMTLMEKLVLLPSSMCNTCNLKNNPDIRLWRLIQWEPPHQKKLRKQVQILAAAAKTMPRLTSCLELLCLLEL